VEFEGPAPDGPEEGELVAWLFHRGDAPRQVALDDVAELARSEDNFVWVQLWGYTAGRLRSLGDVLALDPAAVAIAADGWQIPRIDVFDPNYVVAVTVPRVDAARRRVFAGELDLFLKENLVVSVHRQPPVLTQRALERARRNPSLIREDTSFLVYIMLDELLAYYEGLAEHVEDEVEQLEERALTDDSDEYLTALLAMKQYAFALGRLADQQRNVFVAFLRPDFPFEVRERMSTYFRELAERHASLVASFTEAQGAINAAFDIYVSQVSHRTNRTVTTLTVLSGLLLPATLLLTLVGTQAQVESVYGGAVAWALVAVVAAVVLVATWAFVRRGWLTLPAPRLRS
jgi:magnesium transporter